MEQYRQEIEKEANEYADYSWKEVAREKQDENGSMQNYDGYDIEDCLKDGFIKGVNSKISERIRLESNLQVLEDVLKLKNTDNLFSEIENKITELKKQIDLQ